jgi:voltage-gated potassium channel
MSLELLVAMMIAFFCLLLHVAGLLVIAEWLLHRRDYLERTVPMVGYGILLLVLFSMIMFLHLVGIAVWGIFYYSKGWFNDFETAVYFSLSSYTTIGYGDVLLPQRWRLLGGIEGIAGVLLCGLSTAFLFAVMNAIVQIRIQRRSSGST